MLQPRSMVLQGMQVRRVPLEMPEVSSLWYFSRHIIPSQKKIMQIIVECRIASEETHRFLFTLLHESLVSYLISSLIWIMSLYKSPKKTHSWLRRKQNPNSTIAFGCCLGDGWGFDMIDWLFWPCWTGGLACFFNQNCEIWQYQSFDILTLTSVYIHLSPDWHCMCSDL